MTRLCFAALVLGLLLALTASSLVAQNDKPITTLAPQWSQKAPTIDGKLAEGEWAQATKVETRLSLYTIPNLQLSKELPTTVYATNDAENLYLAIVIKGEDYDATWQEGNVRMDLLALRFDADNDGKDSLGDDQKVLAALNSTYLDQYRVKMQAPNDFADDPQQDGKGAITHSTQAGKGDYVAELAIPLNTHTAEDLAATPGDELYFQLLYAHAFGSTTGDLAVGLIAGGGTLQDIMAGLVPSACAKLKLATQP